MSYKIKITGLDELNKFAANISKNTTEATRIAINTSVRWGRTRIREDVGKEYNVKLARLYASDRKKGLNTKLATNNRLEGSITAGHMPIGLNQFNGTKQSTDTVGYNVSFASSLKTRKQRTMRTAIKRPVGMQVEIRKGRRQVVKGAFQVKKFGSAVFARGQYGAMGFMWRHKRKNTAGPDLPIEGLNSTSVATMALNKGVFKRWQPAIEEKYSTELSRQLKRLV